MDFIFYKGVHAENEFGKPCCRVKLNQKKFCSSQLINYKTIETHLFRFSI